MSSNANTPDEVKADKKCSHECLCKGVEWEKLEDEEKWQKLEDEKKERNDRLAAMSIGALLGIGLFSLLNAVAATRRPT